MPGPAPKFPSQRRRRNEPARGEWKRAPGIGWQHGPRPKPPSGLMPASRSAWAKWFSAWFAAHWGPGDVPQLCILARLFDAIERGELQRAGELRLWMDNFGITPAGYQARRWQPPEEPIHRNAQQATIPDYYKRLLIADDLEPS
jgi:hypothetical protein